MTNQIGWRNKPIPPTPAGPQKARVNLRTADFDALVKAQGVKVKVFRSSYCPNVKSISGAEHEVDCKLCYGAGFIDKYCLPTQAFIQNQELEKAVQPEGLYDGNTVAATFLQGVELQYFTLIELQDFTEVFFERIKRQSGNVDVLRYSGTKVNMLSDKQGLDYYEGSDFKLDPNGNILWCDDGRRPDKGMIYTINYDTQIRFRAIRAMHNNRFAQVSKDGITQFVKMNEQWMLQKVYLVERKDIDGKLINPNKIRDEDDDDALVLGRVSDEG